MVVIEVDVFVEDEPMSFEFTLSKLIGLELESIGFILNTVSMASKSCSFN